MSSILTCSDLILQNNGQPLTLSGSTTFHKSFGNGGVAGQVTVPNPMVSINAPELFPGRAANGLAFGIRAVGLVTGGQKYQIDINLGTGLNQTIASTGLSTNGLTADNWFIETECVWDPTSLFLRGIYWGWAGPIALTQATLVTANQPANLAALTFNVAVTCATANPNAVFTLTDFSADII